MRRAITALRAGLGTALLLVALWPGCHCKRPGGLTPGRGSAVVVVDPDEAGRPEPVLEREPNDSSRQAQDLPRERGVEGTLTEGDRDWYKVMVVAPPGIGSQPEPPPGPPTTRPASAPAPLPSPPPAQVLSATLSGVSGADLVLEAWSEKRDRLVRIDNSGPGEGEVLVNLAETWSPGGGARERTVFLVVRETKGRAASGRYRLTWNVRPAEEGEEREPNWKASLASTLPLEGEATGYLGWKTDNDWYRVDVSGLAPGARLRVEYDGIDEVRANLSVRSARAPLQERWGGLGEGVVLANLAVSEGQKDLFVVVRTLTHFNVESRYSVRVVPSVPAGPTEAEPNDRVALATPLTPGTPMAGLLGNTHDRDIYSVKVTEPAVLRVEVASPLNLDPALAVLDPGGRVAFEVDAGRAREAEVLPHVWVQPPQALFQVRAPHAASVSPVAPYHIKVVALPEGSYEREPNPDLSAATVWPAEVEQMIGTIHPRGDVDWYRVAVAGDRPHLRVEAGKLKLRLELFSADARPRADAVCDARGAARLDLPVEAGSEWLLKVSETGNAASSLEPYRLLRENP